MPHSMTSTRRFVATVAVVAVPLSLAACGEGGNGAADTQAVQELQYSSPLGPESYQDLLLNPLFEEIEKETNGAVTIQPFYGGSLIQAPDSAAAVTTGRVDLALGSPQYHPAELPISSFTELPFITSNGAAQSLAMRDTFEEGGPLQDEWHNLGLEVLVFSPVGSNTLNSKEPMGGVDDLDGSNLRAVGLTAEAVQLMGGRANAIQIGEVYESLQRGVVDAATSISARIAVDIGVYEVAKYAQDMGFGEYTISPVFMSKTWWDGLDEEVKAGIDRAREHYYATLADRINEQNDLACERLAEAGVTLSVWADEEVAKFTEAAGQPILESWIEKQTTDTFDAADFLETYQELIAQYDATDSTGSTIQHCVQ